MIVTMRVMVSTDTPAPESTGSPGRTEMCPSLIRCVTQSSWRSSGVLTSRIVETGKALSCRLEFGGMKNVLMDVVFAEVRQTVKHKVVGEYIVPELAGRRGRSDILVYKRCSKVESFKSGS